MYKLSLKSVIIAFFAMCLVSSCQKSVKGKWTDADKAAFSKEFKIEIGKMVKTDESLKMFNVTEAEIATMSDCSLAKIEAAYTPAEIDKQKGDAIEKIGEDCAASVLIGKKGTWSPKFKEMMKVQLNGSKEDGITAEQQKKLTDCIISKAESALEPKDLANSGAMLEEIGKACGEELMKK